MFDAGLKNPSWSNDSLLAELDELRFMLLLHEASIRATFVGQFEWNHETNRLGYCSKEYAQMFGHRHTNIADAQSSWEKFIAQVHPDDREPYLESCEQRHAQKSVSCEYRVVLPSGDIRHIQETNIYSQLGTNVIRGNFGTVRDISLQKRVEAILASEHNGLETIDAFNDMGGFLYDEVQQRFLHVDALFANIYGVDKGYMLDEFHSRDNDFEFVYPEDRELLQQVYEDYELGDIWEAEYRMVQANGNLIWVREIGKSYLVIDDEEVQSIGMVLDISDRKQAELDLTRHKENLEKQVATRTSELENSIRLLRSEVEERKKAEARLQKLAHYDQLTGLPGVRLCMDRLSQAMAAADRNHAPCAIMFLDLDHFKSINDNHGHGHGDEMLKTIADRFRAALRKVDTVARIGGDEFLVILSGLENNDIVERIATKLIEEATNPVHIDSQEFNIGLSIGIALYPVDGADADDLIRSADDAMYRAKKSGRNCFKFAAS